METETIETYKTDQILSNFDKINKDVETSYSIFERTYDTAFQRAYISDIVNGETINIKKENILVDNVDMEKDKENFELRLSSCTKKLYDYQIKAIRQLIELEQNGYYINPNTGNKVVSNGWLLSLPIGSGKSIVFLFLALWYRNVPKHPIIVSRSGRNIPIYEQMQFKYYPYFYETCSYIEKPYKNKKGETYYYSDENCIVKFENYIQQPTTVILTHAHLIEQMRRYIMEDFPKFYNRKGTNINFCYRVEDIRLTDNIVIIPAYEENVKKLVEISHERPFMRVIIDDYTSMPNIDSFRQILASSTIFVSGSGFERSSDRIPTSYYTLKYANVPEISIVGSPEDTYKGVVRNNIAMIKLFGSSCDFSDYNFIEIVDDKTKSLYNTTPKEIYPYINSNLIKDYMGLYFILINKDKLRSAINSVNKDYNINGMYKTAKFADKRHEIKHFIEWIKKLTEIKGNKLVDDLLTPPSMYTNNNESTPIVRQVCMSCKKEFVEHNGYGVITTCCGAFYCEDCIKNATTHCIANKITNEFYNDKHNYYCSCCRRKNPTLFVNMSKKKDKSVHAYNIIDNYFETDDLKGCIKFDYYFYMLIHGLVPKYHNGVAININNEIERGILSKDVFEKLNDKNASKEFIDKTLTQIRHIFSLDHIMIRSLECINRSLVAVDQKYTYEPYILFYNAPTYMENRLKNYIKDFDKFTSFSFKDSNGKKIENPIMKMQPLFMSSIDGLIGIHLNVVAIIVFDFKDTSKDGIKQLLGRCLRINTFNNKITFFITPDTITLA